MSSNASNVAGAIVGTLMVAGIVGLAIIVGPPSCVVSYGWGPRYICGSTVTWWI